MPAIVIFMALAPWIGVLYDCGHDPSGILTIVYDDPQPTARLDVLAIEALAAWSRVQGTMVGTSNGSNDDVYVVEQPRRRCARCSREPASKATRRPSGSVVWGCSKDTAGTVRRTSDVFPTHHHDRGAAPAATTADYGRFGGAPNMWNPGRI
jgi:hypothetical protein